MLRMRGAMFPNWLIPTTCEQRPALKKSPTDGQRYTTLTPTPWAVKERHASLARGVEANIDCMSRLRVLVSAAKSAGQVQIVGMYCTLAGGEQRPLSPART